MKLALASTIAVLATAAVAAKDERTFAVLRFNGKQLTVSRTDPIVNPGVPSTHVHHVVGGSNFGMSSTGEELRKSKCTNAMINGDNSNYWWPSLYFKDPKTGKFESVELFYANVYYFFEPTNDKITAFPVGLSMMTGDPDKRSPPEAGATSNLDPSQGPINQIKWTCPRSDSSYSPPSWPANSNGLMAGMGDPRNKGEGVGFPDMNCDGFASPLRADIHFPSCYNPKAGLTDYKNNMAWPTENNGKKDCPEGYIHVPHLFYEAYWNTPEFAGRWEEGKGEQPFVLSSGDATGYSLHADFMSGWDEDLLQHIIDTCNAGTTGMDKCPGLTYGVNKDECKIDSPVKEKVTGVLDALPGANNEVTGWRYGGTGGHGGGDKGGNSGSGSNTGPGNESGSDITQPSSGKNTAQPAATSKNSGQSEPSKAPAHTEAPTSSINPGDVIKNKPEQAKSSCKPAKTHTVWETVTVTADAPASPTDIGGASKEVAGFKYAGCFKDGDKRVLSGEVRPDLGAMTNEKCVSYCQKAGFALAGTEYGGQCYCGNEIVGSERLNDTSCNMACENAASDVCGGDWALTVYSKDGQVDLKNAQRRRHMHDHARRHLSGHR